MNMQTKWHEISDFEIGDRILVDPIYPTASKHRGMTGTVTNVRLIRLTIQFDDPAYNGKFVIYDQAKKIKTIKVGK